MSECTKTECKSAQPAYEVLRCVHWRECSIWLSHYGLPYPNKQPYWCVVAAKDHHALHRTEEPNCHEHYENHTEAETRFFEEEERLVAR